MATRPAYSSGGSTWAMWVQLFLERYDQLTRKVRQTAGVAA
jgi:hypothetical protein